MPIIVCPNCGDDLRLAKVSAVHSAGRISDLGVVTETDLSGRLAPPIIGNRWRIASVLAFVPVLNILLLVVPIKFIYRILMIISYVISFFYFMNLALGENSLDGILPIFGYLCGPGIVILVFYYLGINATNKRRLAKWNELYYCSLHDIVINANTSEYGSPEEIMAKIKKIR